MIEPHPPRSHFIELLQVKREWRVLVLANNNTSIAMDLAPLVNHVTLVCPTILQARQAEEESANHPFGNITCRIHDSDDFPYANNSFDLLVCYHAAHSLCNLASWLFEASRVLCPGGSVAVVTNLVPGTRLRGKKARKLRDAADYINAFNRLRKPEHHKYHSLNDWEDMIISTGFQLEKMETADRWVNFVEWADEVFPSNEDHLRLRVMLVQAPEKVSEFLTPKFAGAKILFRLPEVTILAISTANID